MIQFGPCARRMRTWTRHGVTLIELLVVVAIIGIAAAATVPALPNARDDDALAAAADDIKTLLARAHRTATSRGVIVRVALDPNSARYWVTGDAGDEAPTALAAGIVPLGDGVALMSDEPRQRVTFHPTGLASGGPIVLRQHWRALSVSVDRWTGEPHVLSH